VLLLLLCCLQELGLDTEIVAMACQAAEILMIMRQVNTRRDADSRLCAAQHTASHVQWEMSGPASPVSP
jgi:hypothetical protein